jgi:hypothetical protein
MGSRCFIMYRPMDPMNNCRATSSALSISLKLSTYACVLEVSSSHGKLYQARLPGIALILTSVVVGIGNALGPRWDSDSDPSSGQDQCGATLIMGQIEPTAYNQQSTQFADPFERVNGSADRNVYPPFSEHSTPYEKGTHQYMFNAEGLKGYFMAHRAESAQHY